MKYTKDDIVVQIGSRWILGKYWLICLLAVANIFISFGVYEFTSDYELANHVLEIIMILMFGAFFFKGWVIGKKYWNKIKDT